MRGQPKFLIKGWNWKNNYTKGSKTNIKWWN